MTTAQDVLRSLALANRMLGGGYETNLRQRAAYVFFDKKADRLKAMQQAQEGNYLSFSSEALLTTFTESNFHWDKRGYTVFQNRVDSIPSVILTDIDSAVLGNDAYSSPQIIIGLLNSASTNVSGMPLPGLISFEKGSGGNESSHTSAHVDERKLEYFLRLASSNAYGGKLCARFLDYHGLLPHWSDSFLPNATQIGGFNRLKSTLMCEFIAGQGKLGELFRETRALTPGDKQSFKETIKTVLGYDYDELERRFRTWLGPLKPEATGGILQQLTSLNIGGQGKELKVATPAELALQILEPIRARALDPKDILPIFVDEELSEGATAHARYLTLNPDEYRYPEVHTEKSTLPGFTKEGRMRAASSVISGGGDNMEQVINGFMRTFYHRLPLITPNVFAINAGVHEKNTLIDCSTGVMAVQPVTPYVCWPPSNEKNVPTTAYAEVPAPLPGHDMSLMGFPISVVVNNPEVDLKNVEIKLYKGDPKDGVLVDCHFISPFNNPQPLVELTNEFGLIPKVPLQTSTEYTTVVAEGSRVLIQNSFITERTRSK
ncbi:MAG: hypothetical protein R3A13_10890 [Bdellovibrionota bacterium]